LVGGIARDKAVAEALAGIGGDLDGGAEVAELNAVAAFGKGGEGERRAAGIGGLADELAQMPDAQRAGRQIAADLDLDGLVRAERGFRRQQFGHDYPLTAPAVRPCTK